MASERFNRLRTRGACLRKAFLPVRFSKTGTYPVDVLDRAAAFRIMLCAELETYLENEAAAVLECAQGAWNDRREINRTLASLMGSCKEGPAVPTKIADIDEEKTYVSEIIRKSCGTHRQIIQNNKGTKDFNILRMFVPLGLDESELDIEFLAECNTITALRGNVAHNTIDHATALVDPRTEFDRYHRLLAKARNFDSLAENLLV